MKIRRRTTDSHSVLPDDESLDNFPSVSTVEQSATTISVQPETTTGKSNVWVYFERSLSVGPLKAKCTLCQEDLLTPNYATSSLKWHLLQRHDLKQFASKEVSSPSSSSISVNLSKAEKQKLDSLAVDAIIKDSRTFGDFQKSGLKKIIDALRPGYKAPHRNFVVKKLKRLNEQHTAQTKVEFEEAKFLSIMCDFWTNRQQKSFLVITGHYVDNNFNEHSKILKFMTFEERHYSIIIAQEIEKQLIHLGLYDKLVTITCDGAYNMRHMFTYFSRRNIKYIQCVAHKFHLVICNSLNLWTTPKKKRNTTSMEETTEVSTDPEDDENESQATLNQMIRTMSVDIDQLVNENNNTDNETNDTSQVSYDSICSHCIYC
ncbi:unnamed protein product [Rotaria magnacalcarata]|uniref:BED-type domain-containing protein n=2 Tax=Rotaria magnacalcarata TaxID=392030 RepID=A0A815DWL7_9BILA|nr:unnamed protein product [Rotaria magnacalcarata]CAF4122657.1 unnamed protein product [Rotaria magnacalcarata]